MKIRLFIGVLFAAAAVLCAGSKHHHKQKQEAWAPADSTLLSAPERKLNDKQLEKARRSFQPLKFQSGERQLLELQEDKIVRIPLAENATTGYTWQVFSNNTEVIRLVEDCVVPAGGSSKRVGAPGMRVFAFKACRPGNATLTFAEMRPWENDSEPAHFFTIDILISEDD